MSIDCAHSKSRWCHCPAAARQASSHEGLIIDLWLSKCVNLLLHLDSILISINFLSYWVQFHRLRYRGDRRCAPHLPCMNKSAHSFSLSLTSTSTCCQKGPLRMPCKFYSISPMVFAPQAEKLLHRRRPRSFFIFWVASLRSIDRSAPRSSKFSTWFQSVQPFLRTVCSVNDMHEWTLYSYTFNAIGLGCEELSSATVAGCMGSGGPKPHRSVW